MKVKSILLIGLIAFLMAACGDTNNLPPDPVAENCSGCEWIQTIAPTCIALGVETRTCSIDTSHAGMTQVIVPLGHDSGAWHSTAATCTEYGPSELRCTRCDHVLGTSSALALGHDWGAWTETTPPTCTTAGEQTRICSIDNYTETQVLDLLGHDSGEWHSTASTCEEYGPSELRCTRCAHVLDADSTPAYGHDWDNWAVTTAPTCTTAGVEKRICSRNDSHTETQVLNLLGHDSGAWHSTAEGTCTKYGTKELRCTRCSSVLGTDPTPVLGHSFGIWIADILPTCTTEGVETRTCSIDSYTETQPIPIVSTAHSYGAWVETTAPTCTTAGVSTRTCSHNAAHTETQPIAALGHDWSGDWAMGGRLYKTCQRIGCNEELTINFEMMQIQAGTFTMGSPTTEPGRNSNETQHQVRLTKDFYMGIYQVTQEQYLAVMGANPSYFDGGSGREPAAEEEQLKRPVEQVSWYDAIVFCNKLSIMEGLTPVYSISDSADPDVWIMAAEGTVPTDSNATWNAVEMVSGADGYRLPTEAEWEYACRAGTTTAYSFGDSDAQLGDYAWYTPNSESMTHEVGQKAPNAWGLYDMHGNVREWCWDRYGSTYYGSSPSDDPTGPSSGSSRVGHGGSWYVSAEDLRSSSRYGYNPSYRFYRIGFRVVRH